MDSPIDSPFPTTDIHFIDDGDIFHFVFCIVISLISLCTWPMRVHMSLRSHFDSLLPEFSTYLTVPTWKYWKLGKVRGGRCERWVT